MMVSTSHDAPAGGVLGGRRRRPTPASDGVPAAVAGGTPLEQRFSPVETGLP